jgi:FkbH-like protein
MSNSLYQNLAWLPKAPADFATRCRSLTQQKDDFGKRLQALASHALEENELIRLAKTIGRARESGFSFAPMTSFRLGLISNSTVDFIVPALIASMARYGIALECVSADYDQGIQEALNPDSAINRGNPDAVLIALDYRGLPLQAKHGNSQEAEAALRAALGHIHTIRSGIKANSKAACILQTLAPPAESLFGSLDRVLPGTTSSLIDALNLGIANSAAGTEDVLFDVARLAETVGLADWHSPAQWNMAKLPFSNSFLPLYADHVSRIIAALRGKSRRCLVLDLDNTLWGGVIGDDGLEGIQIAQGDAAGEAHLSLQRFALALRERGIVLAVCSKNQDEVARLPFRKHPEMILRENHFAVFQANWNDKATNIKAIAEELSLGLESLVFLDDNPVERALVRKLLPEVAVPEVPDDPSLFVRMLSAGGYFESVLFSEEDVKRADFYQDNARRVALGKEVGDLESYLTSLKMEITFQPFEETGRARITQLINKSNQFNLTTRRYTEAEVARTESDPNFFTLQVRLADIFGDNGMISVVICACRPESAWEIDTWLMSCRVLGRRVENMVLLEVVQHARRRGIRKLKGRYIPTGRNNLVEHHYAKLGFTQTRQEDDGTTLWELDVNGASVETAPMVVHNVGFAMEEA